MYKDMEFGSRKTGQGSLIVSAWSESQGGAFTP